MPPPVWKNKNYADIIIYALAAFGNLSKSVFINDPEKSVKDRLDIQKFEEKITELRNKNLIEFKNEDKSVIKITDLGEDFLIERMKRYPMIMEAFKKFDQSIH